jgi:hypothetical protein
VNGHWVVALFLIGCPIVALILNVRKFLRSPPSPLEFRKQFIDAWAAACVLALGTVGLIHKLTVGLKDAQVIFIRVSAVSLWWRFWSPGFRSAG